MNWFDFARKLVVVLAVIISSRAPFSCPEVENPKNPKLIITKVLIFLLDVRISQLNTLKLKIAKDRLLNFNQLIVTTPCSSYVWANSIDQVINVINVIIQEQYYGLTCISTHNVSHRAETLFCLTISPNADTHWDLTQMPLSLVCSLFVCNIYETELSAKLSKTRIFSRYLTYKTEFTLNIL